MEDLDNNMVIGRDEPNVFIVVNYNGDEETLVAIADAVAQTPSDPLVAGVTGSKITFVSSPVVVPTVTRVLTDELGFSPADIQVLRATQAMKRRSELGLQ